jgi:hypothetical protein
MKKATRIKWFALAFMVCLVAIGIIKWNNFTSFQFDDSKLSIKDRTWLNYKDDVIKAAEEFQIAPEYLFALIALESHGNKEISSRFEPHIYKKLLELKQGKRQNLGAITPFDVINSSDDALKNLASSWGPFQLMGYQCYFLDVKIKELRGKNAVYYGAKWIRITYGKFLDDKRYKDGFHLHNTGKPFPKRGIPLTHDKRYVRKGIKWMAEFKKMIDEEKLTNN